MSDHHEEVSSLSPQEIKFNDLIKRGDDLFNIKIYRYARDWYQRAFEMHVNDKLAEQKINELNSIQKSSNKIISLIVAIAVVIIAAVWIYKTQL